MTQLWLIRHGETDWNVTQRFQGSSDQPLNAKGIAQAEAAIPRLKNMRFDAIYCSDLQRATRTAEIMLTDHPQQAHIVHDERLREIDFGIFEGLTFAEIREKYPKELDIWEGDRDKSPHGGETISAVVGRTTAVMDDILQRHPDERVLLIGHGGTLAILMALLLDTDPERWWQFRMMNCALTELRVYQGGTVLLRFNDGAEIEG